MIIVSIVLYFLVGIFSNRFWASAFYDEEITWHDFVEVLLWPVGWFYFVRALVRGY